MHTVTDPVGAEAPPSIGPASLLRVCIAADNASARFGGEAILPLHYFRLLRRRGVEAWLVAHERVRPELEALLPEERCRMHFVRDSFWHKLFFRFSQSLPRRVSESTFGLLNTLLTQAAQRPIIKRLVAEEQINVLHQPAPVSPRFPSLFFDLGVPLIAGPMNGGMEYPTAFRSEDSLLSRIFVAAARRATDFANALLPGKRRAEILLVANRRTWNALPRNASSRRELLVENGVDLDTWHDQTWHEARDLANDRRAETSMPGSHEPFVFMGRLVSFKALQIVLEAMTQVPGPRLDVIGDGPMLASWSALATDLGLGDRVRFLGWLSQSSCAAHLRSAKALVLPSLFECGGAVVLEAMAMGKPVIATRWGGPADYLDETCGVLVSPESHAALVAGFAAAMEGLHNDPRRRERLGRAAQRRIFERFSWEKKIDRILEIYGSVIDTKTAKQAGSGSSASRPC